MSARRFWVSSRRYGRKSRSSPKGWISPSGSSRNQGKANGRHSGALHSDRGGGRLFRVDDRAVARRESVCRTPQGWLGGRRNGRRPCGVGRKRGAIAPGSGGTGGTSRFYRTADRSGQSRRAAGQAEGLALPAETGSASAA